MGKFDGVLFATDLDSTLFGSDQVVPEVNRRAIAYFCEQGGRFTVATGRAFDGFSNVLPALPVNAPIILFNGALVYDFDKNASLHETWLPSSSLDACLEILSRFPEIGIEASHIRESWVFNPNDATRLHIKFIGGSPVEAPLEDIPLPWIKVTFTHEFEYLKEVAEWFAEGDHFGFRLEFSAKRLLELLPPDGGKENGIRALADLLGIEKRHIYCAGDNHNDISMMRKYTSFAPANARDPVKAVADYHVARFDEGAIAEAIGILDSIY